eukprot:COSAG06_NODE_23851_length_679_cov_1.868966_1_plen_89_part_10
MRFAAAHRCLWLPDACAINDCGEHFQILGVFNERLLALAVQIHRGIVSPHRLERFDELAVPYSCLVLDLPRHTCMPPPAAAAAAAAAAA